MKKILPILFAFTILLSAEGPRNPKQTQLNKSSIQEWKFFDVNNIYCTINSAGPYADYLKTNSSGLFWPKGTSKTAVYTSGIWLVGKHRPTNELRTAVQYYLTEFQPGTIDSTFNTTTNSLSPAADPTNNRFRLYKINKRDNASTNPDYAEWPGDLGAPYNDLNNNGKWDKGIDAPKIYGDQTLWCVYNDVNGAVHANAGMTKPMGIEVHALYFGYDELGPLENTMFIQWKIINKSDASYDSLFIGLWSDLELGDASDDADGYDSSLHLGYVYNGDNDDGTSGGYGNKPPACGTVFLGGKPSLQPYAYPIWVKFQGDPPLRDSQFSATAFNYLKGLDIGGNPNINPITNQPDRFAFTGYPETSTGWTRLGHGFAPSDIRSLQSLGPITLAPGDTQEVNAAFIIAQGSNRLESIQRLRECATTIQNSFAMNFSGPAATVKQTIQEETTFVTLSVDGKGIGAESINVTVISELSNSPIVTISLADDGTAGDATAGDGTYGKTFGLPASPVPVRFNATIVDKNGRSTFWPQIANHIPLSQLDITNGYIVSDDVNGDQIANPGENIRYGFSLKNQHSFSYNDVTVTPLPNEADSPVHIDSLPAHSVFEPTYAVDRFGSFLSCSIPDDYSKSTYTVYLGITDSRLNFWLDSVTFPVQKIARRRASPVRVSGKGHFDFDIIVTDRSAIKDHQYILRGIDSGAYSIYFSLKDSTENRIIMESHKLNGSSNIDYLNHSLPVMEHFKIYIKNIQYPKLSNSFLPDESKRWFSSFVYNVVNQYPIVSSVHYADVPDVTIKFSKRTGFTDTNANGVLDPSEQYTFDITDTVRTQKAFLYILPSRFGGFIDIPFAAYDMSGDIPRKLSVILVRSALLPTPSRWLFASDRIYIVSESYNSDGFLYDSTKGGKNLLPVLQKSSSAGLMPYYFNFTIMLTMEPLKDTGDFILTYTPGFSSRDAFLFKPTDYAIEEINPPTTPVLSQNYPNPFNPSTTIRYSVPKQSHATISIYNILGQRVRTLLNDVRTAGTYEIDWNGKDDNGIALASGMYIYRFASDGSQMTKKMLLLK